jgi:shikimate kinase/3-dehydroquinate synthase
VSAVPLLLSGMMGAGKSAVGRRVATRLGRPFVDLDEAIAAADGRAIPAIFDEDGEAAFRRLEAAELRRTLDLRPEAVVALGGGALLDPRLRAETLERAVVVNLNASTDTLVRRLSSEAAGRPMLAGEELPARLAELRVVRRQTYAAPPIQVSTDGRTIDDVVAEVAQRATAEQRLFGCASDRRRLLLLTDAGPCPLFLGEGAIDHLGDALEALGFAPGPVFVVVDEGAAAFGEQACAALQRAGHEVTRSSFPSGEQHKTPGTLARLWSEAAQARIARDRPFISIGGGVCGDVTGFAAATYQRGVPFVQVPTTLLAMIDASVGGKTAVDLPEGKNLAGAFHQPAAVLLDKRSLTTLPQAILRQGFAEMVKHALLEGDAALSDLERRTTRSFASALDDGGWLDDALLRSSVAVKARIVAADYREGGLRRVLNLGHTFAHALELCDGFNIGHGDAVAVGLCAALQYRRGHPACDALLPRVSRLLDWAGLPTSVAEATDDPPSPAALVAAMGGDKKVKDGTLHLVLLDGAGAPVVEPATEPERLNAAWERTMTRAKERP